MADSPRDGNDARDELSELREEAIVRCIRLLLPTAPDIIRAVPAHHAIAGLGRAFRTKPKQGVYQRSQAVEKIGEFWSHNWNGNRWMKILTLLFLNNSFPAAMLSCLGAIAAACLYGLRLLPGWGEIRSTWCSIFGLTIWLSTMIFWRPQRKVFVDVLCIDQYDRKRKALGVLSIGAFLTNSDSMLVLWDSTYTHRLWCIAEIAAFLHSRPAGSKAKLLIRPTISGPCYLLQTLTICFVLVSLSFIFDEQRAMIFLPVQALILVVGFYITVAAYRNYFRSIETLERKLSHFLLKETSCHCCESRHVNGPLCDKQVIKKCIIHWFGSIESFEGLVRTEVSTQLTEQLSSDFFSYHKCLTTMVVPMVWAYLDGVARSYHYRYTDPPADQQAARDLIRLVGWGLGVVPLGYLVVLRISHCLRADYGRFAILVNLFILLFIPLVFFAAIQLEQLWYWVLNTYVDECCRYVYLPMIWNALVIVPLAVVSYHYIGPPRRVGTRSSEVAPQCLGSTHATQLSL